MTVRQRGQPLIFLALVLVLWTGARIFAWTGNSSQPPTVVASAGTASPEMQPGSRPAVVSENSPLAVAGVAHSGLSLAERRVIRRPAIALVFVPKGVAPGLVKARAKVSSATFARGARPEAPPASAMPSQPPMAVLSPAAAASSGTAWRRWSGDAWVLMRSGGGTLGAGPGAAVYGGNQVGGVLRYRLAPDNPRGPTAYLRVSAALNGSGEREAALGLSVRPIATVPVIVAAEGRIGQFARRTLVRPAVMAVTELPPAALPGKVRAEFYAQAGYVGGAGATPFADGQLRIDRRIVQAGGIEVRAGAGAWGGAQRGAARFDVGPSVMIGASRGAASARLALDWRFRTAGAAQPTSGPALTVSAGF